MSKLNLKLFAFLSCVYRMHLPLFHLVRSEFAQNAWVGFGKESRCRAGSDRQQGRSMESRQTGREVAWKCGMLWTQGPPTKHLWECITQIL